MERFGTLKGAIALIITSIIPDWQEYESAYVDKHNVDECEALEDEFGAEISYAFSHHSGVQLNLVHRRSVHCICKKVEYSIEFITYGRCSIEAVPPLK